MITRASLAARQMAVLFLAAAVLSFASLLRADADADQWALIGVGLLLSAGLAAELPWMRWGRQSDLLLLAPAFAAIGLATVTRLAPSRTYGSLFILLFAWIGAHRRPWTSLAVLPFGVIAYAVPLLASPPDIPFSLPGCVVTLGVCVLIAEALAQTISTRTAAEEERARSAEVMRLILDSSAQPTIAISLTGQINLANRASAVALGRDHGDDLVGSDLHDLMHHTRRDGSPYPPEECPLYAALRQGTSARLDDEMFFRVDGEAFFADCGLEPVHYSGRTVGGVVTFTDVTRRRRAELETRERLHDSERAAQTDPLTGVGNRRYADSFLATTAAGDALVLIDIDHFKRVNDLHGHAAGDATLRSLATHLAAQIRSDDHLARFGGEEFLLLLSGGAATAATTVERIAGAWAEESPSVTFSAGVAAHLAGRPVLETLAAADRALYAAKSRGRNCVVAAETEGDVVRA
jgi:diguanylate cyclase (GGDEF)-like protein/PAS domain S-box-containing protein